MKKVLVILVIIATFFMFQSALEKFDDIVLKNFTTFSATGEFYEIAISGELDAESAMEFHGELQRLLDEFGLNAYQRVYVNREYIVWAHTKDTNYLNNIMLTDGVLTSIDPGDVYFSDDSNERGTIFNPIRNKNYRIYHLSDFSNSLKSVFNPYMLFTDAADAQTIYYAFENELRALYPTLSFFSYHINEHGVDERTIYYEDIIFAVLAGTLVILGLNVTIIHQTKKIQLLKLEGYSTWQIYRKHVLSYLGLILLVALCANAGLYNIYINTTFENATPFRALLLIPNLIFIASLMAVSLFSFATIYAIDINLAVKGKSSLKRQKDINYAFKVVLIVFTTLVVLNGFDYFRKYHNLITTEDRYLEQVEGLHTASHMNPTAVGALENLNFGVESNVIEHLRNENDYFELMFLTEISIGAGRDILYTSASRDFVRQFISSEIATRMSEDGLYILIPESMESMTDSIITAISREYFFLVFNDTENIMIYPQVQWNSVNPTDYIFHGTNIQNAVFLVNNSNLFNISGQSYFWFDGDSAGAQEYFDSIYIDYDATSFVIIESVKDQFENRRAFFLQDMQIALPIFFMIVLAITTNTYQHAILNCEVNSKRYAIMKSEGRRTISLIAKELRNGSIMLIISALLLRAAIGISLVDVAMIIGIYFIIEFLMLWGITKIRTHNFAERLR